MKKEKISIDEFYQLDTVRYFMDQLRPSRLKNLKPQGKMPGFSGTQKTYFYTLRQFNDWISGRKFEAVQVIQTGQDTFRRQKQVIAIQSAEHFLKLYQASTDSKSDYIKVIKQYLLDPMHKNKSANSMHIQKCAILSYFEKNDSAIHLKFDTRTRYHTYEDQQKSLTLEDLLRMLTVGRPAIVQKAVILCKFHRGLDSLTFCDRFNFQVWEQLVSCFGTEIYSKWDLSKCPVPVKLTRIKTGYNHVGFLDRDAIISIQDWLKYRNNILGQPMADGRPLFLTQKKTPINPDWVRDTFRRLARTCGIQNKIESHYILYDKDSHELRDLLKSTLIDSGTRFDVADHVIGHKPKDSYEKQAMLYPETMRLEYAKASHRLNIFSRVSEFIQDKNPLSVLEERVRTLEKQRKEAMQLAIDATKSSISNHARKLNLAEDISDEDLQVYARQKLGELKSLISKMEQIA